MFKKLADLGVIANIEPDPTFNICIEALQEHVLAQ